MLLSEPSKKCKDSVIMLMRAFCLVVTALKDGSVTSKDAEAPCFRAECLELRMFSEDKARFIVLTSRRTVLKGGMQSSTEIREQDQRIGS